MKSHFFATGMLLFFASLNCFAQGYIYADNQEDHYRKVTEWRQQKDADYSSKEKTMLTEELLQDFTALNYYPVDYNYRVTGKLTRFIDGRTFSISTTGGQVYDYLVYARVDFKLQGKSLTLNVYQGKRAARSGKKKGALFIPFYDDTSADKTYGGGRYLVLDLPDNDDLVLDFNMAYNPYCVYNPDHSCPIPPRENYLAIKVEAGELMYP
jgi:uncharacterized protein (DUF1684 family)